MANGDRATDKNWRLELKDGSRSLGYFDFEEMKFGTDGGGLSRDPELGVALRAGLDTAEPFDASRPWVQGRDRAALAQLKTLKNRKIVDAHVWELDPATDQPLTSDPDSYKVMIREATHPKGNISSADESRLVVNLEPQP